MASIAIAQTHGTFVPAGDMNVGRAFHTALRLRDGRVFIVGGSSQDPPTAEIYDPLAGAFTVIGNLTAVRSPSSATLLADGSVFILGAGRSGEIFDPATNTLTPIADTGANGSTAIALNDGRVLIAGFTGACCVPANTFGAWVFDPSTRKSTPTGSFVEPKEGYLDISTTALLSDGRVLFAAEPISEIWDPATGTFSLAGPMGTPCILGGRPMYISGRTATLLNDGNVLLTGGEHEDCGRFATAELFDPATGAFNATGGMSRQRDNHRATLLANGKVLITGGEIGLCNGMSCGFAGTDTSAEIYDPATGTFSPAGNMAERRAGHAATLLPNGTVLITGGYAYWAVGSSFCCFASTEVYTPPAARRRISRR